MNCPTRDENADGLLGYNQNPSQFAPELTTRASLVCGGKKDGSYNVSLHVVALFIVLVQSTISCAFPIVVKRFPQFRVPHHFLFLARHFGTGVLLATAFVHLLPTAFISLTDPCLPKFWTETYPAMAGAIALAAVFFVVTVEMIFSGMGAAPHSHGDFDKLESSHPTTPSVRLERRATDHVVDPLDEFDTVPITPNTVVGDILSGGYVRPAKHRRSRSGSMGSQLTNMKMRMEREAIPLPTINSSEEDIPFISSNNSSALEDDRDSDDTDSDEATGESTKLTQRRRSYSHSSNHRANLSRRGSTGYPTGPLTETQQQQKLLLQVMLLEAGILFHSIFIGMALSVATGSNFIVLLIAIVFHQTFEGLALGARIASITAFPRGSYRPWMMALAYGTTTPIGQAIGLATHTLYDPASETGLLMVGVMNAISSGLLLFAGLVELLAEDFLSDESWRVLVGRKRIQACGCVFAGAFGMAFVGAFA